jgi:transposase
MKQDNAVKVEAKDGEITQYELTIGLDVGDTQTEVHVLDRAGRTVETGQVRSTPAAIKRRFAGFEPSLIAMEVGGHSRWMSQLLQEAGHKVLVANARQIKYITASNNKSDRVDAEKLARLARVDPQLLHPIRHRSENSQRGLMLIRARAALVRTRTLLINCVRGMVKITGARLQACDADVFAEQVQIPAELNGAIGPIVEQVKTVTASIRAYDKLLEKSADELAPDARRLTSVPGVGLLTAVTFVLTLDEPTRLGSNRTAGALLGLVPKRSQSGQIDKALGITKAGDPYLRQLLVQCAQRLLQRGMTECDLRDWGLQLAGDGRSAKKRAVVAVARKLSVLLMHLWTSGETFDPRAPSRERDAQQKRIDARKQRKLEKLQEKLARPVATAI